jgi:hypothetical protein
MAEAHRCQQPYLPESPFTGSKGAALASVFLSYAREDGAKAQALAAALERAGHSVWWDRNIRGGTEFSEEIEAALNSADMVLVLWSRHSVKSAWVRDEAAAGRDSGRLIPVRIDDCRAPMGFRQYQTIDLSQWSGRGRPTAVAQLLEAVGSRNPSTPPAPVEAAANPVGERSPKRRLAFAALAVGLILASVAGLFVWRSGEDGSAPAVAVRAGDSTPQAATLARGLLVRLGSAQSGELDNVEIIDERASQRPDLILEVSGDPARNSANLVLLRASDRQLLSSQELAPSKGMGGDLETSIAIAATGAIGCTTAALASKPKPSLDLLKQFVGACEKFNALYGMEDISILIPKLEQAVEEQPHFLPAWREMLLAGVYMLSIPTDVAKPSRQWLCTKIDAARRLDPDMPEAQLAELQLLPITDFEARIRLVDALREAHPDDKFILGARAEELMLVGRNNDAVVDAERSARLDPFAPYSRSEYIRTLAFSGRLARSFEELDNFKPFPPVAMNVADTGFRVNMRYGDPKPALNLLRMYGTSKAHEAFLIAKISPTPDNIDRALAIARSVAAQGGFYSMLAEVLATFGREDELFQTLTQLPPQSVDEFTLQSLFRPVLKRFRGNPRFLRVAKRFGLLEYWQSSGHWPDFCLEADLGYDCKTEAAKLSA